MSSGQPDKCPVNHSKFSDVHSANNANGWAQTISLLFWAPPISEKPISSLPPNHEAFLNSDGKLINSGLEAQCPVGSEARQEWLNKMKNSEANSTTSSNNIIKEPTSIAIEVSSNSKSCSSNELPDQPLYTTNVKLPMEREISSIPKTNESGNWIYPSQKQFFEAMQRKNWNPEASDMQTIVPIHNSVNEQAWRIINIWEKGQGGEKCGGIKLTSFKGDSKKLTPRARWRLLLGYDKPFDRHDWTVNRCGQDIDYVIDFYSIDKGESHMPQFYLDVRPKLNSLEGFRLRFVRAIGL